MSPDKSHVSIKVLENILNGMDAFVYVSDPETDEILFVNDKMRTHFNLKKGEGPGLVCWKVFQSGLTERCSFCPNFKLAEAQNSEVVWEERNSRTGRYYKNTDSWINWSGGKKVHLQHSVDITDLKLAEKNLEEKADQQKLMADVARIFISKESFKEQAARTLKIVGEFMNLSSIIFGRCDMRKQTAEVLEVWKSASAAPGRIFAKEIPFKDGAVLYDAFIKRRQSEIAVDDVTAEPSAYPREAARGIRSFMAVPIYLEEDFWGVLQFDNLHNKTHWTESEIQIARLIGSIFSSAVAKEVVQQSLVQMSAIVNSSPRYIICTDAYGNFTFFNRAVLNITGYSREELLKGGMAILHKEAAVTSNIKSSIIPEILEKGKVTFETTIDTKYGDSLIMSMSGFLVDESKGEVGYIATDITSLRALERELMRAKEEAEQASRAKGEFLARMSHEIRTPLNAVLGMTSIAKATKDADKKNYCLEKIETASVQLLGIVNDILDMSKIEAGKLELAEADFDLEKMLVNVTDVASYRLDQKKQNLILDIERNVPQSIIGDEMRLGQVLTNLLTNASKFTPEHGVIKVHIRKISEQDGGVVLRFEVEDNGIGISPEQQHKLFRSFEQADGSISRRFGGTGLGLAISKRIVELMGGAISVNSDLGKGAKFIFTIKTQKGGRQNVIRLLDAVDPAKLRVLAVDDAKEIRDYFLNVMGAMSIKCDTASGGEEALEIIKENKCNPYNIVFVDWMMPGMNGVELIKKIKEIYKQKFTVIMISASEWSEVEARSAGVGIDRFLNKPLFPSSLINVINESLTGTARGREVGQSYGGRTPDFSGGTILIAEDVAVNREIMQSFLECTKAAVDFAFDGREAVEKFRAAPDKYDCILMDIQMPGMDGLEATAAIRALSAGRAKTVPVIALTANVFSEDINSYLAAGMNGHIGKPVNVETLFKKLAEFLHDKNGAAAAPPPVAPPAEAPDFASFLPLIDVKDGLNRLLNNKKLYSRLLENFRGAEMAAAVSAAVDKGSNAEIRAAAHALKGVAANLGFQQIKEISSKIEALAKEKNAAAGLKPLAKELSDAVTAASSAVEKALQLLQ